MKIYFNNSELDATVGTSLATLLTQLALPNVGIALAVNNTVIPKTKWAETLLNEEDRIVVIRAACGG